ncbi:MAG: hypothetical protein LDLANPLL_01166 [Turneriella sp.]|nr:hypothetical protein [Turneriella sp.]
MGLLAKSIKKARTSGIKSTGVSRNASEKKGVDWVRSSFYERSQALTDKIDLEAQYEHLGALTQTTPRPTKLSLRERARKLLSRASGSGISTTPPLEHGVGSVSKKSSLREKAAKLLKRIRGTDGGGVSGVSGSGSGTVDGGVPSSTTSHQATDIQSDSGVLESQEDELIQPWAIFPWNRLNAKGELENPISFGENFGYEETEQGVTAADKAVEPLVAFTDTMERISENLKNLHSQLDKGSFIRDVYLPSDKIKQSTPPPLTSHHVSTELLNEGGESKKVDENVPTASAKDIFWPKTLPIDLPTRSIKIAADGSLSVVPGPFQLPYLAEDIVGEESEYSHFFRSLKNAELFIREGELQLTKVIYEKLLVKIQDKTIKEKIEKNLDALEKYRRSHDWGSFMPLSPWNQNSWQRNPWQEMPETRVNVSEMPVEAKNITINLDKGFFEIARALFELKDSIIEKKSSGGTEKSEAESEDTPPAEGTIDETEDKEEEQQNLRQGKDRRKGAPDTRGGSAPERRSGRDRRKEEMPAEEPPEEAPSAQDGESEKAALPQADEEASVPDTSGSGNKPSAPLNPPPSEGVMEPPEIPNMAPDGNAMPNAPADTEGGANDSGSDEDKPEENKVQEIRGVLELKTPDQEDTPFLTLTYDFTKIPHSYHLAKDNGIFEYAYYKYKPMLVKAHQFIKRKQITRALNYYRVIREQQIPTEFRHMVDRNIKDITEYLQKYLVTRAN